MCGRCATRHHTQMQQHIENLQGSNANTEFSVFFNFAIQKLCIISIANEISLSDETTLNQLPTMINVLKCPVSGFSLCSTLAYLKVSSGLAMN